MGWDSDTRKTKLGQRGYAVHENRAEYISEIDPDTDSDTDTDGVETIGTILNFKKPKIE